MKAKTFLHILGWVILGSWLIHFLAFYFIDSERKVYSIEKIIEGVVFIVLVVPVYFSGVTLYYKFFDDEG